MSLEISDLDSSIAQIFLFSKSTTLKMAWPYHLVDLTEAQKHERRLLLDRYGVYAQLSALVPILCYQLYRLAIWVSLARRRSKVKYYSVPSSPDLKHGRGSREGVLVRKWRTLKWWLEGDVGEGWGIRGLWVAGGLWASWLGFLCVRETGDGMCFLWFCDFCVVGFGSGDELGKVRFLNAHNFVFLVRELYTSFQSAQVLLCLLLQI